MWLPIHSFQKLELCQLSIWLSSNFFIQSALIFLISNHLLILALSRLQTHQILSRHLSIHHIQLILEVQHLLCQPVLLLKVLLVLLLHYVLEDPEVLIYLVQVVDLYLIRIVLNVFVSGQLA